MTLQHDVTEPARELAELGRFFASARDKGTTINTLCHALGIGMEQPELHDLLGAIQRRVTGLEQLINEVAEPHFDQRQKDILLTATQAFRQFLHPRHANQPWASTTRQFLSKDNIIALDMFGRGAIARCGACRIKTSKTR